MKRFEKNAEVKPRLIFINPNFYCLSFIEKARKYMQSKFNISKSTFCIYVCIAESYVLI